MLEQPQNNEEQNAGGGERRGFPKIGPPMGQIDREDAQRRDDQCRKDRGFRGEAEHHGAVSHDHGGGLPGDVHGGRRINAEPEIGDNQNPDGDQHAEGLPDLDVRVRGTEIGRFHDPPDVDDGNQRASDDDRDEPPAAIRDTGLNQQPLADEADRQRHTDQAQPAEHDGAHRERHAPSKPGDPLDGDGSAAQESCVKRDAAQRQEQSALHQRVIEEVKNAGRQASRADQRDAKHHVADLSDTGIRQNAPEIGLVAGDDRARPYRRARAEGPPCPE